MTREIRVIKAIVDFKAVLELKSLLPTIVLLLPNLIKNLSQPIVT
nr:MAG TPA: hypothetical protein [Bacteriophage sp.]